MAIQYVTYARGLRHNGLGEEEEPLEPGEVVTKDQFEPDEWDYHIQHGSIVRKGGPHDPEVLAAANEPEEIPEDEDPRDFEIRQLREQLALLIGRGQTPAPATHLSDLADAQAEEGDAETTTAADQADAGRPAGKQTVTEQKAAPPPQKPAAEKK